MTWLWPHDSRLQVGLIIGRGGETIKNLQSRSGARIQVLCTALHICSATMPRCILHERGQEDMRNMCFDVDSGLYCRFKTILRLSLEPQRGWLP
jgi:hypothetical protein